MRKLRPREEEVSPEITQDLRGRTRSGAQSPRLDTRTALLPHECHCLQFVGHKDHDFALR